jgi:hypothetical protein
MKGVLRFEVIVKEIGEHDHLKCDCVHLVVRFFQDIFTYISNYMALHPTVVNLLRINTQYS